MKIQSMMALGMALLAGAAAAQDTSAFDNQKDRLSYALGMGYAATLKAQSLEVDPALLSQGFRDASAGGKTLMTEEEARATVTGLQVELKKRQTALRAELKQVLAARNKADGEAFMAENRAKDGIVTLDSGLQYRIMQPGEGKKPAAGDSVVCHYRGTLIDGTEFDSSFKRKQPASFALGKVIPGWREALQLMPAGSRWQIFVPPNLAYGERGAGKNIGPNATLVFEVELIAVKEAPLGDGERTAESSGNAAVEQETEKVPAS